MGFPDMNDHLSQFSEEFIGIQELRDDQASVERSLDPPAGEHDVFEKAFDPR